MNGGASRRALSTSTRQPSNEVNRGDTWFVSRRERDIIPGTGVGWPEDEGLVDAHYGRLRRLCERCDARLEGTIADASPGNGQRQLKLMLRTPPSHQSTLTER